MLAIQNNGFSTTRQTFTIGQNFSDLDGITSWQQILDMDFNTPEIEIESFVDNTIREPSKVTTTMEIVEIQTSLSKRQRKNSYSHNDKRTKYSESPKKTTIRTPEGWTGKNINTSKTGKNNTTLILKKLPQDASEKTLKKFFIKNAGPIKFINILINPDNTCKGIAFIRFETKTGSDKGSTLDQFFYNGRTVNVSYAEMRK